MQRNQTERARERNEKWQSSPCELDELAKIGDGTELVEMVHEMLALPGAAERIVGFMVCSIASRPLSSTTCSARDAPTMV